MNVMSFTDCPRCANQGLMMPLKKEDNQYVCDMCKSVYQDENQERNTENIQVEIMGKNKNMN